MHRILLDGAAPLGGRWNFDRQPQKYKGTPPVPPALSFLPAMCRRCWRKSPPPGSAVLARSTPRRFLAGQPRRGAGATGVFCQHLLPTLANTRTPAQRTGVLFHSRLSFCAESRLISPAEVINAAVAQFLQQPAQISLAQIEGFVRQILGWREYVRGVYWKGHAGIRPAEPAGQSPPAAADVLDRPHAHALPSALTQSLRHAYAHHIQRLMVIGNFALLSQRHPDAVDAWYLGCISTPSNGGAAQYRGMSQYADGGLLAKANPMCPQAVISTKMSNYCAGCAYQVKARTGHDACPFNSLYWRFSGRQKAHFAGNPHGDDAQTAGRPAADELVTSAPERRDHGRPGSVLMCR